MLWIVGSKGLLGSALSLKCKAALQFVETGREVDIGSKEQIADFLKKHPEITHIVNCAAFSQVDAAEEKREEAYRTNALGPENLSLAAKKTGRKLIHISTDYVFDGQKGEAYTEEDAPNPLNVYGQSKLKGEEAVRAQLEGFLVFRLSWVFGEGQQNFLYKLSQWAKSRESLKIVNDEISVPTSTEDVVQVVFLAVEKGLKGTYHLTNSGKCSRYEWAKYYFDKKGTGTDICPVSSDHFPVTAKRPLVTYMSNRKICKELNPIAQKVIFTKANHPRACALNEDEVKSLFPDKECFIASSVVLFFQPLTILIITVWPLGFP